MSFPIPATPAIVQWVCVYSPVDQISAPSTVIARSTDMTIECAMVELSD